MTKDSVRETQNQASRRTSLSGADELLSGNLGQLQKSCAIQEGDLRAGERRLSEND